MKKPLLLFPIDFADCTHDVAERAVSLAQDLEADMLVLHVLETPAGMRPNTVIQPDPSRPAQSVADYQMDEVNERLPFYVQTMLSEVKAKGEFVPKVTPMVAHGKASEVILQVANEVGATQIIMGTHGREGIMRVLLGSVAETIARKADVPVTLVRGLHNAKCPASSCFWCTSGKETTHVLRAELDG